MRLEGTVEISSAVDRQREKILTHTHTHTHTKYLLKYIHTTLLHSLFVQVDFSILELQVTVLLVLYIIVCRSLHITLNVV